MIKPYGLSQPPTPVCGIQTLPAFCHKERFLSYIKKGGGGVCVQVFNNKPSDSPQSSHQVSLLRSRGKARVNAAGREKWGFSPETAAKPALIAREAQKNQLWGSSVLTGCPHAGAGVPAKVP